jgi:hypothetical protein
MCEMLDCKDWNEEFCDTNKFGDDNPVQILLKPFFFGTHKEAKSGKVSS